MARKRSWRQALREFNRQQVDLGDAAVEFAHLRADHEALEKQVDAVWQKYQVAKAVTELEALRANGGQVH